ncbi:hypothetical protein N0V93_007944 [Gnomoniopsis smithogilvyi]|uniref:Nephrocystin 3-like N-terminal domain-containing protein n=1 Tax=Gnomoniopsis smithogilvyi TaxID=1191159 RepID=A0A9W8YN86_9PEZI|nr:hypothetical protein N0V93_007944 [Gnomoniopsis smithogilvyi]
MKVARDAVKAEGLTTLYEPDDQSEIDLDIVFIHGLGGHPVKTWLQTSFEAEPPPPLNDEDEPNVFAKSVTPVPTRKKSMRRDKSSPVKKRGNTLKKRPPNNKHASPASTNANHPPQPQPQLAEPGAHKTTDAQLQHYRPVYSELTRSLSKIRSKSASPSPVEVISYQESKREARGTYWPLDLLPESCPSARIFTYGFETHKLQNKLSIGQLDIFARARELLEAVDELRRDCKAGREVVFLAHSTGGIIVKEVSGLLNHHDFILLTCRKMLRLASNHGHTDNQGLLASIASVIFMGCPLSGTDYGSMVIAMKSMAAVTTGVLIDDSTLGMILGGEEDAHLTYLGRDAFEALWREYNFRVKVFRETTTEMPLQSWAELGLALRRDASTLSDNLEEDEDVPGDHANMCRFASRRDEGYQRVSSYILRMAHHQALKRRQLSEKESQIQQAFADPGAADGGWTEKGLPSQRRVSAALSSTDHVVPSWLLQHPRVQTWLRRGVREDRHKLLWLNGPPGSGITELLSSLRAHLARDWAPETHSSVIITIAADVGQPLLDSIVCSDTDTKSLHGFDQCDDKDENYAEHTHEKGDDKDDLTTQPKSSVTSAHETPQNTSPTPNTPVRTLRSLLSQLYTHDPRLRNLVCKRAATAGTLHSDDFLVETLFPIPNFADSSKHDDVVHRYNTTTNTQDQNNITTNTSTNTSTNHSYHATGNALDWLSGSQIETRPQGQGTPAKILDDADVWALFWEEYLCLGLPDRQKQQQQQQQQQHLLKGKRTTNDDFKIGLPTIRRVFILVDAAGIDDDDHLRSLLCWLKQLAQRSEFSVCIASSTSTMLTGSGSSRSATKSPSNSTLLIQVPEENADEIRLYLDNHLVLDMEERSAIAAKMLHQAAGVMLWVEMVTTIVNEASEEGVSGEIVLSMLDDIAPGRHGSEGLLDDLYAWKLRRLSGVEQAQALAVMQWVMLAPEPLRLNELLIALRLTLLACRRGRGSDSDGRLWDVSKTLVVEPAVSLKELRAIGGDALGIGTMMMDSPSHFWKWLKHLSQGLLRLESESKARSTVSSEPLGLQRVRPMHESVHRFFLKGKGFQTLLPTPSTDDREGYKPLPSTDRFINNSYYILLHVCLVYLNITELDALGREKPPLNPAPGSALPPVETSKWRAHADTQRHMVMASYPLLRYVVDHLVFHLLCPREYRYFLPQGPLLALFAANRCRIWRRWTHLLGFSIADASPEALLAWAGKGPAVRVLAPVYGARYRLERVLRRVWRTAVEQQRGGAGAGEGATPRTTPKRTHFRARSDVSEGSMVFMLMGSEDPLKASWLVPTSPGRPKTVEGTPRALTDIEEAGGKEVVKMEMEEMEGSVSV